MLALAIHSMAKLKVCGFMKYYPTYGNLKQFGDKCVCRLGWAGLWKSSGHSP